MYDRATNTLWHQFTGTPIIGELQGSGIVLDYFPTARTTWGEWRNRHPDTTVLSLDGAIYPEWSYLNETEEKSIYFDYRANPETMFPIATRNPVLAPKAEILGVSIDGNHKAYQISQLQKQRIIHDEIANKNVIILASGTSSDAHIYDNNLGIQLQLPEDASIKGLPEIVIDTQGNEWRVDRYNITNIKDASIYLPAIPSNIAFWFGWFAFHPDTELYDGN